MRLAIALLASSAVVVGGVSTPASAVDEPSSRVESLSVSGYDAQVAQDHGFKIVTDSAGVEHSVPVTASAKQIASQYPAPGSSGATTNNTKRGSCGTSSLFISRYSQGVRINTAYSVYAPSFKHTWNVDGSTSTVGAWSENFSGLNASTTWTATHDHKVGGASSALAAVRYGSTATLIDGTICATYGPTDSY